MTIMGKLAIAALGAFALLQAVRPSIPVRPATAEVQASPEVKRILEKNCYSCHSDQRRLSWFDEIVPGYWLVRRDIIAFHTSAVVVTEPGSLTGAWHRASFPVALAEHDDTGRVPAHWLHIRIGLS